jgi:bifunctional ADP-heptose synthase (sugar kinase/adenylyltransferase)
VTGAGDTVISTFSLALASGLDLKSAAVLSNYAAGIVVGEVGTSTVSAGELKKLIGN